MTTTIRVNPRRGANAVYNDMRREDLNWILAQLERVMIESSERTISTQQLDKNLTEYMNSPQKELGYSPKHQKQNTAASVIGGILKNVRLGNSRDLTDKICDKVKIIFDDLYTGARNNVLPDLGIQPVRWEEVGNADTPPNIENFNELFGME